MIEKSYKKDRKTERITVRLSAEQMKQLEKYLVLERVRCNRMVSISELIQKIIKRYTEE